MLPQDTLTHTFGAASPVQPRGLPAAASRGPSTAESDWQFWGLPGNESTTPIRRTSRVGGPPSARPGGCRSSARSRCSSNTSTARTSIAFRATTSGMFGDSSVSGYQSGLVRAEEANGAPSLAGDQLFREDPVRPQGRRGLGEQCHDRHSTTSCSPASASGARSTLPWQLIMNFEVGYAVAGPGKGNFAVRVFFLKLFPGS